ncbi:hypothetical protein BpHYR1_014752 [Brachionus plicatilis]|uniref:Uncharacterized protein n=1 Tax=Brachionus plicatilis TaxID=10195 RepID=A0A3M7S391_BRAPC|nr:hypothetical protein BpHYR1_014752 [Brachionus plicatilis]
MLITLLSLLAVKVPRYLRPSISHPSIEPEPRVLLSVPLLSMNQTAFCIVSYTSQLINCCFYRCYQVITGRITRIVV